MSYISPCFLSYVGPPLWMSEQLFLSLGLGFLIWNTGVISLSINSSVTPAASSCQDPSVRAGPELADLTAPWVVSLGRGRGSTSLWPLKYFLTYFPV